MLAFYIVNTNAGILRMRKLFSPFSEKNDEILERTEAEMINLMIARSSLDHVNSSSIIPYRGDWKVIHRRYAALDFSCIIENTEVS